MTGLVFNSSWSPSPLIISRDSLSLWTWARIQTARSTAYFNGCPYISWCTIILLYMFVYHFYDLSVLIGCWSSVSMGGLFTNSKMFVLLITGLLRLVGRLTARNRINHTSGVTGVTLTDRPKPVCNRCLIVVLVAFLCCHVAFWIFLWV